MSTKLNKKDYIKILNFYNTPIPDNKNSIQEESEKILSSKLCRCIKKVGAQINDEPRSIGICTKTIFNKRGFKRGKFTCKGKRQLSFKKTRKTRTLQK
jgi:hypothetical protein